jgi:hypothetical protein
MEEPGVVVHVCNFCTQEDEELEASLDCIDRPYIKKKKKSKLTWGGHMQQI